ncbi:hypothetical protein TRFO_25734 [Tritrichomonas foetus]|uniref:Uncharacterized protein n=1 Tax=Tritrichomonas foetus TaxID=1144522 RepID=A0A1J4K9Y4_9EUKA|nr:hypothetical protein TRFO_25734 [Tritrichomonas foetus]|eukprot:OHT06253.1 hypothetical protein TRFO_25734 [Tritrichomonas foetus]
MKKSVKAGNQIFIHLVERTLLLDKDGKSEPYPFSVDLTDKILDFSFDEPNRQLRVFTTDGDAIITGLNSSSQPKTSSLGIPCICASIHSHEILAITNEFRAVLLNFRCETKETYTEITKPVRFCLLTSQLKVLADSTLLYVRKTGSSNTEWKKHKFHEFYVTHLIGVNRQLEFGLTTYHNTRICHHSRPQSIFRSWAKNTVCLLQCPCTRKFYAHLDSSGILRIGDNEADFTLQEKNVTGICWEMGVLWARDNNANWHRVVMAYEDQLYDMRTTKLSGMEAELNIQSAGQVINILEALKERPALSQEIMAVLPPIAQNLTDGIIVNEVKKSLDAYIKKSDSIYELLGQIDLALKAQV